MTKITTGVDMSALKDAAAFTVTALGKDNRRPVLKMVDVHVSGAGELWMTATDTYRAARTIVQRASSLASHSGDEAWSAVVDGKAWADAVRAVSGVKGYAALVSYIDADAPTVRLSAGPVLIDVPTVDAPPPGLDKAFADYHPQELPAHGAHLNTRLLAQALAKMPAREAARVRFGGPRYRAVFVEASTVDVSYTLAQSEMRGGDTADTPLWPMLSQGVTP